MKKLLLGSMLVLGATSFGAVLEDIDKTGASPATLNIRVKGTVVDGTKHSLIVKPLDGTNSTDTMQFNFDGLTVDEVVRTEGKYSAGVYKNNILIEEAYKIEASLKRGNQDATANEFNATNAMLKYSMSEPQKNGREYRGNVVVEATGKAKGTFLDNGVSLEVFVKPGV